MGIPGHGRRTVSSIRSLLPRGFCPGVYAGDMSFRVDDVDNCQTAREARGGRLDECQLRASIGQFRFHVR